MSKRLTDEEREEWLNRWDEKSRKGFIANPYMEYFLQSYTNKIIENLRNPPPAPVSIDKKKVNKKPTPPPIQPKEDSDDDDTIDLTGGLFD